MPGHGSRGPGTERATDERAADAQSRRTVLVALGANVLIALAKIVGALLSSSAAMFAEAAHSVADCVNQLFLLVSLSFGRRRATETHPFGHGMERFFWALLAAIMIFVGGALFSVAQGLRTMLGGRSESGALAVAVVVLLIALVAESTALARAVCQLRRGARADGVRLLDFVRQSRDPTVKVVLAEDSAAVVGVVVALAGVAALAATGDVVWDGLASLLIGGLLAVVAFVVGRDAKRLLIGEAATPADRDAIERTLLDHRSVVAVSELLTMHLGPDEVLVAARVEFADGLSTSSLERAMDDLEHRVATAVPGVRHLFIDPTHARRPRAT